MQATRPRNSRVKWIAAGLLAAAIIAAVVMVGRSPLPRQGDEGLSGQQTTTSATGREKLGASPVNQASRLPQRLRLPQRGSASWQETDDPATDGWGTEEFHLRAKKQLSALGNMLTRPGEIDVAAVAELITHDFTCGPLLPGDLTTVLEDELVKIERGASASSEDYLSHEGSKGLARSLRAAVAPFSAGTNLRIEFKIFEVRSSPTEFLTRQYVSLSGPTESGTLEQHATWIIRWAEDRGEELPLVRSIRVEDFEQSALRHADGTLFADCTESVLGGNTSYAGQFLHGMNHWFERIQETRYYSLFGNPGLAVGDVNGDGLSDVYVCQETGLPNRLFIQQPDASAREVSAEWGVDWLEASRSALLVDLDNDGDQDLVVAILGGVVVAENDGQRRFRLRDVLPTSDDTMSLCAADYDLDGRLDLYVCVYHQNRGLGSAGGPALGGAAAGFVTHDAKNGGGNSLFRNEISSDGTWKFTDVTADVGLDANRHGYSFAAAWEDIDNDRDLDLYVANDFGRDSLYRNDRAESGPTRFVDISESAHIENSAFGMSISWGDYDRDGWIDAYVANMWSAAGNRVTFQSQFKPDAAPQIKQRYQRLARGNTLLKNLGDGTFADRSGPVGVEMGRWSWGSNFIDVNNDGWEDLVVSNGFVTNEDKGDL